MNENKKLHGKPENMRGLAKAASWPHGVCELRAGSEERRFLAWKDLCSEASLLGWLLLLSAATYGGPGMTWAPVTSLETSNLLPQLQQTQV